MIFREIAFGSDDFQKECELRNEVLRVPLGLSLFDEDLGLEGQQMHFGMFDQNKYLVACVIAVGISSTEAKIRQMAVDSQYQGKGLGRSIIHCIEDYLAQRGFTHLFMHARMTAVGFYEKLGYARAGHEFMEVGIPHVKMEKTIHPAAQPM
jgi:predicted GNAT family N-acyltransferase